MRRHFELVASPLHSTHKLSPNQISTSRLASAIQLTGTKLPASWRYVFYTAAFWPPQYCVAFCFAKMLFFKKPISSTPVNGSLRNFNTWRVSAGNRKPRRDILGITPPPKLSRHKGSALFNARTYYVHEDDQSTHFYTFTGTSPPLKIGRPVSWWPNQCKWVLYTIRYDTIRLF